MTDPNRPNRRTIRLTDHDYRGFAVYFLTLVTDQRLCIFGDVVDGQMILNDCGQIVQEEWLRSAEIRPGIRLDTFVVMPNHLHGIILLAHDVTNHEIGQAADTSLRRPPRSVGSFIAGFKAATTKRVNVMRVTPGVSVWQRNYYEHVVRSDADLGRIREYVVNNPAKWEEDTENPTVREGKGVDEQ